MAERVTKADLPLKTDEELLDLIRHRMSLPSADTVGDFHVLEGAIGALFVGQKYGLKILRIIHSSKTLRQYERFYGVPLEELVPQHGPYIDRSYAWTIVTTVREYWDLVARKLKLESADRRAIVDART
jgi:hypothetical protein